MTSEMIIRCLVPWLGSKRTLGEDIVTELGAHTHYVEPCCGSMAPLLVKKPSQKETANDLHGDLTNLAYVVQDFAAAVPLYERLCQATGQRHDPCVIDVFLSITHFLQGDEPRPWWDYTAARKRQFPDI